MKAYTSKNGQTHLALTFDETIRMNSLIQGKIDMAGFDSWFVTLNNDERIALTRTLFDIFICEKHAGGKEFIARALALAKKDLSDPLVVALFETVGGFEAEFGTKTTKEIAWLGSLSNRDLHTVFQFCVYLFGVEQGDYFNGCAGKCDHWWHKDLKNPKVVAELLRNNGSARSKRNTSWWRFW